MWCAIQVIGVDGKSLWLSNPDIGGRRSLGSFQNAAVFWRLKHAETVIGTYMCQKGAEASEIRIVDVDDKILGSATAAS
jgi:hypothetical protein